MIKDTELAWLGGIWDGEGSIFMAKQKDANRVQLRPTISMDNTDPGIIAEAHRLLELMGVHTRISESWKGGSTKTVYRICSSNSAYLKIFLETMIPYLWSEKKAKAILLLSFVNSRIKHGKVTYSTEEIDLSDQLRSSTTTRETPVDG